MLCLRCMSRAVIPSRSSSVSSAIPLQARTFSALTALPTRPRFSSPALPPIQQDPPCTTSFTPLSQPFIHQVRGAKRDTFNPSHVVRKRRLGFLARKRTRTGRAILKRRMAKKRTALTH